MHGRFVGAAVTAIIATAAVFAPSALATPTNPRAGLFSVSCSAPGDCGAVGMYNDLIGWPQAMLMTETGGEWSAPVEAQLPSNANRDPMEISVATLPPSTPMDLAMDSGLGARTGFTALQCSSPGNCTAVGTYIGTNAYQNGMFLSEVNGTWQRATSATAPKNTPVTLYELSCTSSGNCTALGSTQAPHRIITPVVYTETNGSWSRGPLLKLPASAGSPLAWVPTALSCATADACVATADAITGSDTLEALVLTETDGRWTATKPQLPANANAQQGQMYELDGADLAAVSCPTAGACTIAGQYEDRRLQEQPFVVTESDGSWNRGVELNLPSGAATDAGNQSSEINQLDCSSAGNCTAVGDYTDTDFNEQGLLLTETGGSWASGVEAALPQPYRNQLSSQTVMLTGLSCASPGNCLATGSYRYGSYLRPYTNVVLRQTGGTWSTGTNVALPGDSAHIQANVASAISCITGTEDCATFGSYTNIAGDLEAMTADATGGIFQPATALTIPPVNQDEIDNSLLSIVPFGGLTTADILRGDGQTATFRAAISGRLVTRWSAKIDDRWRTIATLNASVNGAGPHTVMTKLNQLGRRFVAATTKNFRMRIDLSYLPAKGAKVTDSFEIVVNTTSHRHIQRPTERFGSARLRHDLAELNARNAR